MRIGRRGSLSGRLTVHGMQGHVAYPERADNPIHRLAPALAELTARVWDQGSGHFQPTSLQFSNIGAGTGATNVIPGELTARFNLRWSPAQTLDGLKAAVREILDRHGLRYALDWSEAGLPFYSPPARLAGAVADAVFELTGRRPQATTGGGTSDGRFIHPLGAEIVELGVINESIHKIDECCRVEDIDLMHRALAGMLARLLPAAPADPPQACGARRRLFQTPPAVNTSASTSTQAGIDRPRNEKSTLAHSPPASNTRRITSVTGSRSSMNARSDPQAATVPSGCICTQT